MCSGAVFRARARRRSVPPQGERAGLSGGGVEGGERRLGRCPRVVPDVVPDAVPDAVPDVVPDVGPVVVPDAVPNVGSNVVPDALPYVVPDVVSVCGARCSARVLVRMLRRSHPCVAGCPSLDTRGGTDSLDTRRVQTV